MAEQDNDSEQILIKMEGSPYYVVQPPLYNWSSVDMKAHIDYMKNLFDNKETNLEPVGPKLVEPWRYRLASEYNAKYNEENNINPFNNMETYSTEETDEDSA